MLRVQTGARLPDSRHSGVDTLYMCMEFWLRGLVVSPVSVRLCACKHTVLVKCICPKWRWVPSRKTTNDIAIKNGWVVISMKNDWKRVFAFEK